MADGVVGPSSVRADGSAVSSPRCGQMSEAVVSQAHGKYYEAVSRGKCFSAQTAATGVAPGTSLGTTAGFALYNPVGSGKRLSIQKIKMGLISGTIGAGTIHICSSASGDAVPTGTAITPRNRKVGSSTTSVATALTTATVTTTAAKMTDILCSLNQVVVATTANNPVQIESEFDGELCIEPGFGIAIHGTTAAGSSPLVVYNVTWEEIDIPS